MPPDEVQPECLLHVFLLTYDRAPKLRKTLEWIADSALKDHPLTIMDNCSSDSTPQVCAEFAGRLPLMEVRRHARNIGFGPNYFRSIECSRGEYTWILCDDDTLYPERMQSLVDLLANARPEACFVGGPRQEEWPAGTGIMPMDIQMKFRTFMTAHSFVPGTVFKTALIGAPEYVDGYYTTGTKFPQSVIGRKLLVENIPCSVLHPPVLQRELPSEVGRDPLENVEGWSDVCRRLPGELRKAAFYSIFVRPDALGMVKDLARMILWMKIDGRAEPSYRLARIATNVSPGTRMLVYFCGLGCLIPGGVYHTARECYRKIKYGWLGKPLPPTFYTRIEADDLRR